MTPPSDVDPTTIRMVFGSFCWTLANLNREVWVKVAWLLMGAYWIGSAIYYGWWLS